jgi:hypothetical protein
VRDPIRKPKSGRRPSGRRRKLPFDPAQLAGAVEAARERIAARLPEVDPGDLVLILQSLLRPIGTGKRFLLRRRGGRYVF